jgi:hypothetical protein
MKLVLLLITPLLASPTLIRREEPYFSSFWGGSGSEASKGDIAAYAPAEDSDSSWFSVPEFGIGSAISALGSIKSGKQALKKGIISSILPFTFGVHQLREAKDDLKEALNDPSRRGEIPFKELKNLQNGLFSFENGVMGTVSRFMDPFGWFSPGKEGDEETLREILTEETELCEKEKKME